MVTREVEGPVWLVPMVGRKPLSGHCWRSGATLGAYVSSLGLLLGTLWVVPGCALGFCGSSRTALGSYVDGLELLFWPLRAVLGRSWPKSGPGSNRTVI